MVIPTAAVERELSSRQGGMSVRVQFFLGSILSTINRAFLLRFDGG